MRDPPTVKVHEPQSPLSSSLTGDSGCQKGDNNESVDVPTPNEQYRIAHPESAASRLKLTSCKNTSASLLIFRQRSSAATLPWQ